MDILVNFLLSILSSIIAAVIIFITAAWLSKNVRRALTSVASTLLKIDVKFVFTNSQEAGQDIKEAFTKTRHVRIFTGRGNEFQGDLYSSLLKDTGKRGPYTKILLPDPIEHNPQTNWIDYREREIAAFDKAYGKGTLRRQVENNLAFLKSYLHLGKFEVRKYSLPHIGRIILTDEQLFLQPYEENSHGRHSPVTQYGRGSTYDMYSRFFDMVWEDCKSHSLTN